MPDRLDGPLSNDPVGPDWLIEAFEQVSLARIGLEQMTDHAPHLFRDDDAVRGGEVLQSGGHVDGQAVDGIIGRPIDLTTVYGDAHGQGLADRALGLDGKGPNPVDEPERGSDRSFGIVAPSVWSPEQSQEPVAFHVDHISTEAVGDGRSHFGHVASDQQPVALELVPFRELGRADEIAKHHHHPGLPTPILVEEKRARRVFWHHTGPVRGSRARRERQRRCPTIGRSRHT